MPCRVLSFRPRPRPTGHRPLRRIIGAHHDSVSVACASVHTTGLFGTGSKDGIIHTWDASKCAQLWGSAWGSASRVTAPSLVGVKSSQAAQGSLALLGCSILKPAQSLVARGAISSLALGSASSAVLALCENGRLCEWRVRRLATAPPARQPVPLLARSAACPVSSAGLHPAAPLHRPRAPCTG